MIQNSAILQRYDCQGWHTIQKLECCSPIHGRLKFLHACIDLEMKLAFFWVVLTFHAARYQGSTHF